MKQEKLYSSIPKYKEKSIIIFFIHYYFIHIPKKYFKTKCKHFLFPYKIRLDFVQFYLNILIL